MENKTHTDGTYLHYINTVRVGVYSHVENTWKKLE
jgi:hypothetical protein